VNILEVIGFEKSPKVEFLFNLKLLLAIERQPYELQEKNTNFQINVIFGFELSHK